MTEFRSAIYAYLAAEMEESGYEMNAKAFHDYGPAEIHKQARLNALACAKQKIEQFITAIENDKANFMTVFNRNDNEIPSPVYVWVVFVYDEMFGIYSNEEKAKTVIEREHFENAAVRKIIVDYFFL